MPTDTVEHMKKALYSPEEERPPKPYPRDLVRLPDSPISFGPDTRFSYAIERDGWVYHYRRVPIVVINGVKYLDPRDIRVMIHARRASERRPALEGVELPFMKGGLTV